MSEWSLQAKVISWEREKRVARRKQERLQGQGRSSGESKLNRSSGECRRVQPTRYDALVRQEVDSRSGKPSHSMLGAVR